MASGTSAGELQEGPLAPQGRQEEIWVCGLDLALLLSDQGPLAAVLHCSTVRAGKALICSVHQLCLCTMQSITFSSPTHCLSHPDVSAVPCPAIHPYSSYPALRAIDTRNKVLPEGVQILNINIGNHFLSRTEPGCQHYSPLGPV